MLLNKKISRFLTIGLGFIALVLACLTLVNRYQFETKDHYIDLAMHYKDIDQLATNGGIGIEETLTQLKQNNLSSVVLHESSLQDFINEGRVAVFRGHEIINMFNIGTSNRFILQNIYAGLKVNPKHYYIIVEKKDDFYRIRDFMILEFGKNKINSVPRYNVLEVIANEDHLFNIGMGIDEQKFKLIHDHNLSAIIALKSSFNTNRSLIRQKFSSFKSDKQSLIFFSDDAILGYPSFLDIVKNKIKEHNLLLGLHEFSYVKGLRSLTEMIPKKTLLIHEIPQKELIHQNKDKYILRYLRAAKERRINVCILPLINDQIEFSNPYDFNIDILKTLSQNLKSFNFNINSAKALTFDSYKASNELQILFLSICLFLIFMLMINENTPLSLQNFVLSFILFLLIFYASKTFQLQHYWKTSMAFLSACIFPFISMVLFFPHKAVQVKHKYAHSLLLLFKTFLAGLAASLFIISFLSDPIYLMGIKRFIGVKTSFLIPIILTGLYFYLNPQRLKAWQYVVVRILKSPLHSGSLLIICSFIFIITILILRSGNYVHIPMPKIEQSFREFLELHFFARPRYKEFLIGYPVLMLSYYFVDTRISRHLIWFFVVIGSIAPISLINSFCHIHTPLSITIYRSILGLLLGSILGSILIGIFVLIGKQKNGKISR